MRHLAMATSSAAKAWTSTTINFFRSRDSQQYLCGCSLLRQSRRFGIQRVETVSGKQLFHVGPLTYGTNNIGEFLAIVHAAAAFKNSGRKDVTIYTDSITAIAWVKG